MGSTKGTLLPTRPSSCTRLAPSVTARAAGHSDLYPHSSPRRRPQHGPGFLSTLLPARGPAGVALPMPPGRVYCETCLSLCRRKEPSSGAPATPRDFRGPCEAQTCCMVESPGPWSSWPIPVAFTIQQIDCSLMLAALFTRNILGIAMNTMINIFIVCFI